MAEDTKYMWEILVPTYSNEGKPFRTRHHREWDKYVLKISGGQTILTPVMGRWLDEGELYNDRNIPVRFIATEKEMKLVAERTKKHYSQLRVCVTKLGESFII